MRTVLRAALIMTIAAASTTAQVSATALSPLSAKDPRAKVSASYTKASKADRDAERERKRAEKAAAKAERAAAKAAKKAEKAAAKAAKKSVRG